MTILQLQYTSCETGLSGHSGFQFCAMSAGVAQDVLREVEQLTAYEPPDHLRAAAETATAEHPVNLIHTYSEYTGGAIIARVVFTGLDFSNRSGNYFAHTLLIDTPQDDLGDVLPVELWAAPFWQSAQGAATDLPPLQARPSPGPVTPGLVSDFLAGTPGHAGQLESLLAAVDDAMGGGRRVLLVGADSDAVCYWVAAACYTLGPALARRLTFATYSHDPRRCLTHVVGTIAGATSVRLDAAAFYAFDLTTGAVPEEVPISPAAALLARAGIRGSAGLWQTAASLGPLPDSLAECFPVLASAALVLDQPLGEQEADVAIGWLAGFADQVSAGHQASAVRAVLRQMRGDLPFHRQRELVGLAVSADAAHSHSADTLTTEVECAFAADFFARLDRGLPPGTWAGYRTDRGRKLAADGCAQRLPGAGPEMALVLLDWARKAKLQLPAGVVRQVGREVIMTAVLEGRPPRGLAPTAAAWQELRLGMLDRLRGLPADAQRAAFTRLGLDMFLPADLEAYPELGEHWIIDVAERGQLSNVTALIRVADLRRSQGRVPTFDEHVLGRLWPSAGWAPAEAAEIVARLPPGELAAGSVPQRCAAILYDYPRVGEVSEWMTFVSQLSELPAPFLEAHNLSLARELQPAIRLIRQAADFREKPNAIINRLLGMTGTQNQDLRLFLNWQLPPLLLRYPALEYALSNCPEDLLDHFCVHARGRLETGPGAVILAARLFTVMIAFKRKRLVMQAAYLEDDVLAPVVPSWDQRRLKEVGQQADLIIKYGNAEFDQWLSKHPSGGWIGDQPADRRLGWASRPGWLRFFRSLYRP